MSQNKISGQLIVRNTSSSQKHVAGPGRKLVMVFGVLAVPEDFPLEGEHQYAVLGKVDELRGVVTHILPDYGRDIAVAFKESVDGWRPDQLLTAPIWKV